jgi:hypothetical protein
MISKLLMRSSHRAARTTARLDALLSASVEQIATQVAKGEPLTGAQRHRIALLVGTTIDVVAPLDYLRTTSPPHSSATSAIHLRVTLPDGSRGYFPAAGTALWAPQKLDRAVLMLTGDGVRQLRGLVEPLRTRSSRRRRSSRQTSK